MPQIFDYFTVTMAACEVGLQIKTANKWFLVFPAHHELGYAQGMFFQLTTKLSTQTVLTLLDFTHCSRPTIPRWSTSVAYLMIPAAKHH